MAAVEEQHEQHEQLDQRAQLEQRALLDQMALLLVELFAQKQLTLALAESCTAGLVSDLIAGVSGASAVLWGSFLCYSPDAKAKMLGIEKEALDRYPLVSGEIALAMAQHALDKAQVPVAASVTGLAGPGGDGSSVPVGTVWTAVASAVPDAAGKDSFRVKEHHFTGTRAEIRMKAAYAVLDELHVFCSDNCAAKRLD